MGGGNIQEIKGFTGTIACLETRPYRNIHKPEN
jgi:hypothetical protein